MTTSRRELPAVEAAPEDDQKNRLEEFLAELMLMTRKYMILLCDGHETLEFVDLRNGNLIGVGLVGFTDRSDPDRIMSYVPADSILDGVWLVDTADGPREQHLVGPVFPRQAGD